MSGDQALRIAIASATVGVGGLLFYGMYNGAGKPNSSTCDTAAAAQSQSSHQTLRLTYLDMKGVAEPIRLALSIGGVAFEDRRVSYETVAAMRESGELPYGQVPLLEIDGKRFGQTNAILRWVGRHTGLYPPHHQLSIDGVEEALADIKKAFVPQWYKNALSRSPKTGQLFPEAALTPTQQAAVTTAINDDVLPTKFLQLERIVVTSGGPYFCGSELTICDLSFYSLAQGLLDGDYCEGISATALDKCPHLIKLMGNVATHPGVVVWNKRNVK
eukprot:m.134781 g.134781  ORF g.134781 m.134781 type:complete len:273 (+) comp29757_c0_seq5:259-1077(+)